MPFLTVRHISTYRYKQPVAFGEHRVMFRPRDSHDQRLLHASILVDPAPASLHWVHDVFGNCVACVCFTGRATQLRFETLIELDHSPMQLLDFPLARHAERYPFSYDPDDMPDLLRSIERQYPDRNHELARWAHGFVSGNRPVRTADLLARITHTIRRDFTYVRREEMGIQAPLQTLKLKSGSCRDFALLMMEAVRSLGFAARFVSGYLYVPPRHPSGTGAPPDGTQTETPERAGGGSTHAWVQVFLPGAGWMEFDPTNGIVGNHDLIRVAIGRDPAQAVPLWGSWTGFPSDALGLTVDVRVTASATPTVAPGAPLNAAPEPTAPMPACLDQIASVKG
jgi:transglutaminase-like putative cysteine protease